MRVYQVMDESRMNKEDGNRLLDARRVSSYSVGWEVFHVKTAVADWLKNHSTNYGKNSFVIATTFFCNDVERFNT